MRLRGFPVHRMGRADIVEPDALLVDGDCEYADEGIPLRLIIIDFGSRAARLETHARVYHEAVFRKILEFVVITEGGKFPGAVATVPAVAAAAASVAVVSA